MKRNIVLSSLVFVISLSSCSVVVDVDDLTTSDYSAVDIKKPYFAITIQEQHKNKICYMSNFQKGMKTEVEYIRGDDKYLITIIPDSSHYIDYIVADKNLSLELDYVFDNAVFNKCSLDNVVLQDYLTSCMLSTNNSTYIFDARGHLLYYIGDQYYRSDLRVSIEHVFMHRFYIEEKYYDKQTTLSSSDTFTYRDKMYSFEEIEPFIKKHNDVLDIDINSEDDSVFFKVLNLEYTFFTDLPDTNYYLCINDNIRISKDHKIYVKYDDYTVLGHHLKYVSYNTHVPLIMSGDIGAVFDDVFDYFG